MIARFHSRLDVSNDARLVDDKRHAAGEPERRFYAVSRRRFARGVAQDRVVRADGFGKVAVFVRRVGACGEVGDIQVIELLATRGE